jgi:ATP-binding cassette subfamily C protein LapB
MSLTHSSQDSLLSALCKVAAHFNQHPSPASLVSGLPLVEGKLTPDLVERAASRAKLKARVQSREAQHLSDLLLPCIALMQNNEAIVIERLEQDTVTYTMDGKQEAMTLAEFREAYSGYLVLLSAAPSTDSRVGRSVNENSYSWLKSTLGHSAKIYRDVLLASLLINVFVVANPLFVMNVYDRVVPNNAVETLWALSIGILVLYGFDLAIRLLRSYFIELAGRKSDVMLSTQILEKVFGARFDQHPKSVGVFVSQLKDFDAVRNFITSSTITALIDFPFVILFIIVIAYIGGPLVWVPVVLIPMILAYAYKIHLKLSDYVEHSVQAGSQKNATLVESVTQLETLKSLGIESGFLRKWDAAVGQSAFWSMKSRVLSSSATSFSGFIQQISTVLVVIVGVYAIAENELTQGGLIACVILSGRALAPLAQVSALLVQYHQSKLAIQSVDALYGKEQEYDSERNYIQSPSLRGAVEFKAVEFSYPEEKFLSLNQVSLKINEGEKVAIIGKIGSGKSTLQKLLLGLYTPKSGNVLLDNVDLGQFDPADIRANIAYAPQTSELFYGTVRENICLGMPERDDELMLKAAQVAGVNAWINSHPAGFERNVGERGAHLSGGQAQSVVLARALAKDRASLVILDEPTTSMDNSTETIVIQQLKKALQNKTLILVTHKVAMLALVDRLIVMDQGKVVADGEKTAVLTALKKGQLNVS